MDAARHAHLKEIVFAASRLHGAEIARFLEAECAGDAVLMAEAQALLATAVPTHAVLGRALHDDAGPARGSSRQPLAPPAVLGGYRLGPELGRGGMGVVHEATDVRTGERVALKILHPALLSGEDAVERFLREARVGASIAHGGVVRTLDAGRHAEAGVEWHWLVMERVAGRTLRRLVADLGTVPEALAREIARQCAAALAAIHAAGVVHRDLKPENILITDDQRVRIMDLGIAKARLEAVTLTREGQFLGTVSHAAPEQLDGRGAEAASDLYSIGVTLYELVAGMNPFVRESVGATLRAHLEVVPPPPAGVSPFLAAVIRALLEKRPERRLASAAQLQRILVEGEDSAWWRDRLAQDHARGPFVARRDAPLVGRETEMTALAHAWALARAGRGGVVVIEGEPGIGKTRLLAELAETAAADAGLVVHAVLRAGEGPWRLASALAEALGPDAAASLRRRLESSPALANALVSAASGDPAAAEALAAALARWLVAHAQDEPVLWLADDAHAADRDAAAVVRAMACAAAGTRALVVAAGRSGSGAWAAPLAEATSSQRVTPERLGRADVARLVEEVAGSYEIGLRLGPRLAALTDGVPGFVLEVLKELRERGALSRGDDGQWRLADDAGELELPEAARASVVSRLTRLAPEARELLDAAAVHGPLFDAALVAEQLQRPLVRVLQDLADLERRHAVVRSEGRRHAFDCTLLREVVLEEMPEAVERLHHGRLAEALRRRLPSGRAVDGRTAAAIAEHALRGHEPETAAPFVRAAVEHAAVRHEHAAVVDMVARALELEALPADARVVALTQRARSLGVLGRAAEQVVACAEAVAAADALGDLVLRADAVLAQAMHSWARGDIEAAARAFEAAAALAREAGDEGAELRASRNLGTAAARLGQLDEAVALHEACRARARDAGDVLTQAMCTNNLGAIRVTRGDHAAAHDLFTEAAHLARSAADLRIEAHAEGGVGLACIHLGRFEEAVRHALRQAEIGREIGDRRSEVLGLSTAGLAALARGRLDDALGLVARSVDVASASGDPRGRAFVLGHLADVRLHLGSAEAATEAARAGLELACRIGHADAQAHLVSRLLRIAEVQERDEEVLSRAEEALAVVARDPHAATRASVEIARARALRRLGRAADAAEALDEAARRLAENDGWPALEVGLALERARQGKGSATEAVALLARHEPVLPVLERLAARHAAWELTRDVAHLAEAHRLLEHLRAHAPEARRDSMVADVPLHAAVARDWERRDVRR